MGVQREEACLFITVILYYNTMKVYSFVNPLNGMEKPAPAGGERFQLPADS
jgi:hypothetical protein